MVDLTPELVARAIRSGLLDEDLDLIISTGHARQKLVSARKAISLDIGDQFMLVNISPKYMAGERVEVIGHKGIWIECRILGYPNGDRFRHGSTIQVRHSHVGRILK